MDIRSCRGRSHSRLRDIGVIGAGVRAAIGVAKIGKLGGVWGAASPPIIAPPTGIGPRTPSDVTGAGIAGRLNLNKEKASPGVLKAGGVGGDQPISKPETPLAGGTAFD